MAPIPTDYPRSLYERVMAVAVEWRRRVKRLVTVPLGRLLAEYSSGLVECQR